MGRSGGPCGVIAGVLVGLGLLLGRDGEDGDRELSYREARRFQDEFRDRFGSLSCPELIGFDLSLESDREKAKALDVGQKKCAAFVEFGARFLAPLLEGKHPR